ncbi:unnamed protein product [Brassica oleracea var. botrytis]
MLGKPDGWHTRKLLLRGIDYFLKRLRKIVVKTPVNDEKGVARPGENEEKGSEIIVGAQTGGSSDPGAKANEQTPSKTRIKVAKKKVAEVDKSMDNDDEKKVVEAGKKTFDSERICNPVFLFVSQVEDMRITIHSLGKFISHREVKELVQSALLESNTGRDDRILYNKLVRELETI